jgi:hypothetical protein
MRRRTLLQWLTGIGSALPFPAVRAWAQAATFPGNQSDALRRIAILVLPSELGTEGSGRVASQFEQYVRDYRAGADTDHGYGVTRVRPKPPSPAAEYMKQLAALPNPLTRDAIESALEESGVKDLPRLPDGKSVVADLMSFYFRGSDANDLCYRAAIHRDTCRGLEGSNQPPSALKVSA